MKIEINIDPVPASRPRVSKWGTYYADAYNNFKEKLPWLMREKYKDKPLEVIYSPVLIAFIVKPCASMSNKRKTLLYGKKHTIKPDLDNLLKAVLDAGNGIIWKDDNIISDIVCFKRWGEEGKIIIELDIAKEENI